MRAWLRFAFVIVCVGRILPLLAGPVPQVALQRVPDGGIQPETVVDRAGVVHLIYFKGDPSAGDVFYRRAKDGSAFSEAIRVNSTPGTAVAIGNIRGARIAVGRGGHVYVVWNGSAKLADPARGRSPLLFTRLNESGTAFEPERNLIGSAYGIDGGSGIAADGGGRVYVFWHAPLPGHKGEEWRRVWIARSDDDGHTFAPERVAWDEPTGACGCCSLNAYADGSGRVFVLFRAARETVNRDMYLLASKDHGATFHGAEIAKWKVGYCVMSSEAMASGAGKTYAAWEAEKKVYFGAIDAGSGRVPVATAPGVGTDEKYPSLAVNRDGVVLVSWTEGMGWKRGGSVHWQIADQTGRKTGEAGSADGVPVWSVISAYARKDGSFVVLY